MSNSSLLKEFIEAEIAHLREQTSEAAVSPQQAVSERLALLTSSKGYAILVDPQVVLSGFQKHVATATKQYHTHLKKYGQTPRPIKTSQFAPDFYEVFGSGILGVIWFGKSRGCDKDMYNIKAVAAESGYGPLMYDIALSLVYPGYLAPDRNSISKSATRVWVYYLYKRQDVQKTLIQKLSSNPLDSSCELPEGSPAAKKLENFISKLERLEWEHQELEHSSSDRGSPQFKAREEKLRIAREKANADIMAIIQTDPTAWKYRIKKPLGIARLRNNMTRFLDTLKTQFGIKPSLSRLDGIADAFFQSKYDW